MIEWRPKRAKLVDLRLGVDDDAIVERLVPAATRTGIDAPFGWPREFVDLLTRHVAYEALPEYVERRRTQLRLRRTDRFIHTQIKRMPLSVSSDWIAVAAMRCAHLLARLGVRDRSGAGPICEVYPGAALQVWGLSSRGYKGEKCRDKRVSLVATLCERAPWLEIGEATREQCIETDDCFDAVIAALVTRAHARELCEPIPTEHLAEARVEGWIALPLESSLERLC